MNRMDNKLGATVGLAYATCDRDDKRAEQVYVLRTDSESHPIEIDAWVGYTSVARMKITPSQARDLIGLLATAL